MRRVALVTPWFGAHLRGGAERQARELSLRLAARGHRVEILTTCARSPQGDWSHNSYAAGVADEDGLIVRRFGVDARDAQAFDLANAALLAVAERELKPGVSPVAEAEARAFVEHNINSASLAAFLRTEGTNFDAVIFLPYLYGTTLRGVSSVARRALLQPCLHDEPYAYLPAVAEAFRRARRLLFNSEGERELALRLYGPGLHARSRVVGEGVEFTPYATRSLDGSEREDDDATRRSDDATRDDDDATRRDDQTRGDGDALPRELRGARFVLYLGRRDETKNVPLLVRAFCRFKREHASSRLALVLAGEGPASFDARAAGVFDLGVVSEKVKTELLGAARALFQPSRRESFSRVLMESWLAARPVAAHAECAATALAVARARGGWLAATEHDWARTFAAVDEASDAKLDELGARGQAFARAHADWERVVSRYEEIFDELDAEDSSRARPAPTALRAVHQLITDAAYGDAITNHALSIRNQLRRAGLDARVSALRREDALRDEVEQFDASRLDASAGLIYHHSIGSAATAAAIMHAGAKCLVYHNITPAHFFARDRPGFAWLLETGRAALPRLARHFPVSVGDSAFNAAELAACGFQSPGVLPIFVDPDRWNIAPDENLMRELQDGATNLLFVGRCAPNKRQDALVEIFAEYAKLDARARLFIAGEGHESEPYFRRLAQEIARRGLSSRVRVTGRISDAALLAYYRTAHLYLSPSEHEGFGVPLVEAMWFDVPVLARRGTAVTETLADAGLLYDADASPAEIAQLAYRLARSDEDVRRRITAAGRVRRAAFTPAALKPNLDDLLRRMTAAREARAEVA